MNDSTTANLLAALNILVLEQLNACSFKIAGTVPDWLSHFFRRKISSGNHILIPQEFPFLENFLIDAEEYWQINGVKILKSGLWCQSDLSGKEYYFESSAVCLDGRKILLIELLNEKYKEKQCIIEKARQNNLDCHHLQKNNQKKEVLIHCILHDIAGQLNGTNYCFALLELENLTPKARERLEIGKTQIVKQEMLIREILDAFSAEVQSLESFITDGNLAPDALICAQEVTQLFIPTFTIKKMQLQLASTIDTAADWKVVGDKSRLDRVIANLAENAFRHSPTESTVTIGLQQDGEYILITVDNEGSSIPPEDAQTLFQKFSQGKSKSGRAGLGLYFCRITVERWGGEIGYLPRTEGGSRFWFRLPKPSKKGDKK